MLRLAVFSMMLLAFLLVAPVARSTAAPPSESLLPSTTKGYVSAADMDLLREKWNESQLGELANDPLMEPFVEDLREQILRKLGDTYVRLNIRLDDLDDVYGGEVAIAKVQPGGDKEAHAVVLLVDITGHEEQARALLKRIANDLTAQGARRGLVPTPEATLTAFVLPRERGETDSRRAFYAIHENRMIATDHEATAKEILSHFSQDAKTLKDVEAYQATMKRCREATGDAEPHIRWFVEPFGYMETSRAAAGGRKKRGTDLLKVLANQGFTAVRGIGGFVSFSTDGLEMLHRSFVYAPAVNKTGDKYNLAARMMNFPNTEELASQEWIPHDVTDYLTFHWTLQEAFEYSKTLVDEMADAPVFDDILDSLKHDPNGPRIDLRTDLVRHLGQRVSFFTDYRLPIDPACERWMVALDITNSEVVARTLDKAMEADPDAKRRRVGEHTVWEIVEEEAPAEVEELQIAGPGFGEFGEEEEEMDRGPLLSHAAFAVAYDHLLIASHLDFMEQVLNRGVAPHALSRTKDFVMVEDALVKLGAKRDAGRYFSRTDKAYHTTYELIRQGKMPESETLFANLLNNLLGPEEEGVLREQEIQGEKLPEYEKVRGYLGPAGIYVIQEEDGWFVTGCLLEKPSGGMEAAGPMVSRRANQRR